MESLLHDIAKVYVYNEDVLVTGRTKNEQLANLTEVLRCMSAA